MSIKMIECPPWSSPTKKVSDDDAYKLSEKGISEIVKEAWIYINPEKSRDDQRSSIHLFIVSVDPIIAASTHVSVARKHPERHP